MRKLDLDLSACRECPYAATAKIESQEGIPYSIFFYCKRKALLLAARDSYDVLHYMRESALRNLTTIPEWCPLPKRESSKENNPY
jgi:hypothetical protein